MDGYPYFSNLDYNSQHNNKLEIEEESIIEETADCIKQLEERVKYLEGQISNSEDNESVNFYFHQKDYSDNCMSSSTSSSTSSGSKKSNKFPPLEIKAKVSEREILVRVHCKMNQHVLPSLLDEMTKFHLSPYTTNFMPFGDHDMVITIIAQMNDEFCMTVKELVKHLRQAALQQLLAF